MSDGEKKRNENVHIATRSSVTPTDFSLSFFFQFPLFYKWAETREKISIFLLSRDRWELACSDFVLPLELK